MNLVELNRALRQLRLGGMAAVLETRLHQAQAEPMAPIDLISCLVSDELTRRAQGSRIPVEMLQLPMATACGYYNLERACDCSRIVVIRT